MTIINYALGLLPVLAFLGVLVFLDSYKLVKFEIIFRAIVVGTVAAVASLIVNIQIIKFSGIDLHILARYVAPFVEEFFKILFLVYLIKSNKVGFLVDAAILGFALGAGFSIVENVYYLQNVASSTPLLWVVRGFGTAAMHGGTTAIGGMITKYLFDSHKRIVLNTLPGLLVAGVIHSVYNHFFLPPLLTTAALLILQPLLIILFFNRSEKATEHWLGTGLDTDLDTFEAITKGKILETKVGKYLESLNDHFPYNVVADLFEYLKIHLELSMLAKGILLARKLGVVTEPGPEIKEKFDELKVLEERIGPTGKLTILPFLRRSSRELWQIHMLSQ